MTSMSVCANYSNLWTNMATRYGPNSLEYFNYLIHRLFLLLNATIRFSGMHMNCEAAINLFKYYWIKLNAMVQMINYCRNCERLVRCDAMRHICMAMTTILWSKSFSQSVNKCPKWSNAFNLFVFHIVSNEASSMRRAPHSGQSSHNKFNYLIFTTEIFRKIYLISIVNFVGRHARLRSSSVV